MSVDPWVPALAPVRRSVRETDDTVTLTIEHPLAFLPGQFTMLTVLGHGEVPISISGDPARPDELVHTVRAVGSVTRPLVEMGEGATVGVRGPFGTAWPVEQARGQDVLVVAGGIGLAPLRPVILHLIQHRADYQRVVVLVGARTPEDLLFEEELHAWRGRFDIDLEVIVDRADASWRGPVGVVTRLMERLTLDADDCTVMTCGPEIMMRFVVREARTLGVPRDRIWVSMERSMQCAMGHCGRCQWGKDFVCRDGPVFRWDQVRQRFGYREL